MFLSHLGGIAPFFIYFWTQVKNLYCKEKIKYKAPAATLLHSESIAMILELPTSFIPKWLA